MVGGGRAARQAYFVPNPNPYAVDSFSGKGGQSQGQTSVSCDTMASFALGASLPGRSNSSRVLTSRASRA